MTPSPRPPKPEGLNAGQYAQWSETGELRLQRCGGCGAFRHPPRHRCAACASPEWEWAPVSGRGRVFTWAVTHMAYDRGWAEELPYTTVVVELEEGVRLIGATDARDLAVGEPMVAALDPCEEGWAFLTFARPG